MKEKVIITGAGPGGLSAGMLLSARGYSVDIYEKKSTVGGRSALLTLGPYRFDTGPTFLIMKSLLDDLFLRADKKADDYLDFIKVDPLYTLIYPDGSHFSPGSDIEKEMEKLWPGSSKMYAEFCNSESQRLKKIVPLLSRSFSSVKDFFNMDFFQAIPWLKLTTSLHTLLKGYFQREELIYAFAFQAKYIGMSPWKAPSLFSILSLMEHSEGLYHVKGGLNRICDAMKGIIEERGGTVYTSREVKSLIIKKRKAIGVILETGKKVYGDKIILNGDFARSAENLFPGGVLKKWSPQNLRKKKFSCSTFMIYLGLDRVYRNLSHHNIIFSRDYKSYVDEVSENICLPEDPSFYVHNPSLLDETLAPPGHSALYILVPVPNTRCPISWKEVKKYYRDKIIALVKKKCNLSHLEEHITMEKIITPQEWEKEYMVYKGAVFNLGHSVDQMLLFRPHNRFEEVKNLFLSGGGTHPGSCLTTIYQSAKIASDLISGKGT